MTQIERLTLVGIVVMLLASCNSRSTTPPPAPPFAGASLQSARIGTVNRSWWFYAPQSTKPLPLLIVLHDTGSSGAEMVKLGRFGQKAKSSRFILAAPNAVDGAFNDGSGRIDARFSKVDDVALISAMIDRIRKQAAVSHVFVAGFGSGGSMAQRVALALPGKVSGVASVAGHLWVPMTHQDDPQPVPVMLIFGDADPLNPVAGGKSSGLHGKTLNKPAPMLDARKWSNHYHCSVTIGATVDVIRQTSFHSCRPDVPVILLMVSGLGHQWPGGNTDTVNSHLGPQVAIVKATDIIWNFFSRAMASRDAS